MKYGLFLLLIPSILSAKDGQIKAMRFLVLISNNQDAKTRSLFVETNSENEITSIRVRDNYKRKTKTYTTKILNKRISLAKAAGFTLISLRCSNFNKNKGCPISIEYPFNILYGKFKTFQGEIKKTQNEWGFYIGEKKISELRLIAKKTLGLTTGIKRIETI